MNKSRIKIMEAKPFEPTKKEKELYDWVLPIFKKYWNELTQNKEHQAKPKLYIASLASGAYHIKIKELKTRKEYHQIYLPAKKIELAKLGKSKELDLYSGKTIKISGISILISSIVHETCHCIRNVKQLDLNEGIAEWTSLNKVIRDVPDGELLVAYLISLRLIEANLLECVHIRNIDEINLPFNLSDSSLNLIQNELDYHFSSPEKTKLTYRAHAARIIKPHEHYVKGFIKLLHLNTLNNLLLKLYSIKKSPPRKRCVEIFK